MDTRKKILKPAEAVEMAKRLVQGGSVLKVVTGYFDPMLAAQAQRLQDIRDGADGVLVVVTTPENPILAAGARAELVASLSAVDYVVVPDEGRAGELLSQICEAEVVRQEAMDNQLSQDLIQHVRSRHAT